MNLEAMVAKNSIEIRPRLSSQFLQENVFSQNQSKIAAGAAYVFGINQAHPQHQYNQYKNGENVVVHSFRGATTDDMKSYILPTKRRNPGHVVIHVGKNNLESDKTPKEIAKDIYDIAQSLKTNDNMGQYPALFHEGIECSPKTGKVVKVNDELMEIAQSCKFGFVDHSNINPENHLNGSRLHTNKRGTAIIANNLSNSFAIDKRQQVTILVHKTTI